jgi:hypothetical protein
MLWQRLFQVYTVSRSRTQMLSAQSEKVLWEMQPGIALLPVQQIRRRSARTSEYQWRKNTCTSTVDENERVLRLLGTDTESERLLR